MLRAQNTPILSTKHIEHHIERHFETETNKNYYLQQLACGEEFFQDRLSHCLSVVDTKDFANFVLDEHGDEDSLEDFEYLHCSTFTTFFRTHRIDIPRCFRKTRSVRRKINEADFLKFNNYFMRHGKRLKSLGYLLSALRPFINQERVLPNSSGLVPNWRSIFLLLNNLRKCKTGYTQHPEIFEDVINHGAKLTNLGKEMELS
jgi:hypothetical protein